jgi:hypothetical protein
VVLFCGFAAGKKFPTIPDLNKDVSMTDIKQRLDGIKARISDADFLANKGLANEVGIHVFPYDPADELLVRDYVERLVNVADHDFRVVEYNLFTMFLDILSDKRILDKVAALEEKRGKEFLEKSLQQSVGKEAYLAKMKDTPLEHGDVVFITGIGAVYPFMRSHLLLNAMQKEAAFSRVPIVVFYPGTFNGKDLGLFGKFLDEHYYRAFNLL